jgi:hypothetical protein
MSGAVDDGDGHRRDWRGLALGAAADLLGDGEDRGP